MAICKICGKEMTTADGCVKIVFEYKDGKKLNAIKFGDEEDDWAGDSKRCYDCGTTKGHYHHDGCDVQRCPRCSGQVISCDCQMVGDEE